MFVLIYLNIMEKIYKKLGWAASVLAVVGVLWMASCKDDEDPKANVFFLKTTETKSESGTNITLLIGLDKPVGEIVTVTYSVSGTANGDDYTINPATGSVQILAGVQDGSLVIDLEDDGVAEDDETLILTITGVTGHAQIKQDESVYTLTIEDTGADSDGDGDGDGGDGDGGEKSTISFAKPDTALFEIVAASGTIDVVLNIDPPLEDGAVVTFTLSGSATEEDDYDITPSNGTLVLPKGATQATITVDTYEDWDFEVDFENELSYEDIVITLTTVVSGPIEIDADKDEFSVILGEDDLLIFLEWDAADDGEEGEDPGDVDMDLFVWIDNPTTAEEDFEGLTESLRIGTVFEWANIPAGLVDATIGLSYTYYSGSSDSVWVKPTFINYPGLVEGSEVYEDSVYYDSTNRHKWDESDVDPIIVHTMDKVDVDYENISSITVPDTLSRVREIRGNLDGTINKQFSSNKSFNPLPAIKRMQNSAIRQRMMATLKVAKFKKPRMR